MSKDLMRYDVIVEDALRGVVKRVLNNVAATGLPGNHHFYITFRTDHPLSEVPDSLRDRYPEEMTIVLQFQYWDLEIEDKLFTVTLKFNNAPERLVVPFDAITVFADPSVNFALQFESVEDNELDEEEIDDDSVMEAATPKDKKSGEKSGEVVSLDQFRRK
jgi:hypothetical protein